MAEPRPKFIQQNHFPELTTLLGRAVNRELHAGHAYLSMSAYFSRDGVGLRGFSDHFLSLSREKRARALLLLDYLSLRGAPVRFRPVERPLPPTWSGPLQVAQEALELERWINSRLIGAHYRALVLHDPGVIAFLERHLLQPQAEAVRARAEMITRLRRVGNKVGVVLLDQALRGGTRGDGGEGGGGQEGQEEGREGEEEGEGEEGGSSLTGEDKESDDALDNKSEEGAS